MNKTTKGALAAGGAAVLLGGAGTLAYWTDDATVPGADIATSHLKLTNASCGGWILDQGLATEAPYAGTELLVPGDTLTQECTYTVSASGDHLEATLDVDLGTGLTGDAGLLEELNTSGTTFTVGATTVSPGTPVAVADADAVTAKISIVWPYTDAVDDGSDGGVDNGSNVQAGLAAALDDVAITLTQTDTH